MFIRPLRRRSSAAPPPPPPAFGVGFTNINDFQCEGTGTGEPVIVEVVWTITNPDNDLYSITIEQSITSGTPSWLAWRSNLDCTAVGNTLDETGIRLDPLGSGIQHWRRYRITIRRRSDNAIIDEVITANRLIEGGECLEAIP